MGSSALAAKRAVSAFNADESEVARIAAFVRRIDPAAPQGEQVQLDRPASGRWRPDTLDAVTTSINSLSSSLAAQRGALKVQAG